MWWLTLSLVGLPRITTGNQASLWPSSCKARVRKLGRERKGDWCSKGSPVLPEWANHYTLSEGLSRIVCS